MAGLPGLSPLQQRPAALSLLVLFVASLLAGAVFHPCVVPAAHDCAASQGHLDAAPSSSHDEAQCVLCDFTSQLGHALAAAPPTAASPAAAVSPAPPAPATAPLVHVVLGFRSRGPPQGAASQSVA